MTHCPSCGRYVGPYDACPYCAARLTGRLRIRTVKLVAIVLGVIGLGVVWALSISSPAPRVSIGVIDARMNYAYVKIAGTCADIPTYDGESGYLGFWIEDESGEIYVAAYREETVQLVAADRVPALGDIVEVAGTIRLRDGEPRLTLSAAKELVIKRPVAVDRSVVEIGLGDEYSRVRVRGQVREIQEPYSGLVIVTVHDGTGSIPVVLHRDAPGSDVPAFALIPGQAVQVEGAVSAYRSTPQLVPARSADVVQLDEPLEIARLQPLGWITAGGVGDLVAIEGEVVRRSDFSAGVKVTLDDGTGELTVLLWQSLLDRLPDRDWLAPGSVLHVVGQVAEFRGQLEVVPLIPQDVRIRTPAREDMAVASPTSASQPVATISPPTTPGDRATDNTLTAPPLASRMPASPAASPAVTDTRYATALPAATPTEGLSVTTIGAISADRIGEEVTVEGVVADAASFSAGFKFTLDDGTGRIVLVMWHDVYDDCWDAAKINLGAHVRATGRLALYDGELQLQPGFGGDVRALVGAAAWAPPIQIGLLSGDQIGQRVMIEGTVIRVEGISSAVKVFVGDASGEVLVLIWRNVLDRIANNTGLGTPGTGVRVVGAVAVYRSNLEVIPALPVDVLVFDGS